MSNRCAKTHPLCAKTFDNPLKSLRSTGVRKNFVNCAKGSDNPLKSLRKNLRSTLTYIPFGDRGGSYETPSLSPAQIKAITSACGFRPAAMQLFSAKPIAVAEAFGPGAVSMLVPVRSEQAMFVCADPRCVASVEAGVILILAFQDAGDLSTVTRMVDGLDCELPTPHQAPGGVQ